MDVQMPIHDGFDAAAEIRRREAAGRRVPILALTAHTLQGDEQRCAEAGMDGHLGKPIRADELAQVLDQWSRRVSGGGPGIDRAAA
jgi:CheY-like chemotaxis protein